MVEIGIFAVVILTAMITLMLVRYTKGHQEARDLFFDKSLYSMMKRRDWICKTGRDMFLNMDYGNIDNCIGTMRDSNFFKRYAWRYAFGWGKEKVIPPRMKRHLGMMEPYCNTQPTIHTFKRKSWKVYHHAVNTDGLMAPFEVLGWAGNIPLFIEVASPYTGLQRSSVQIYSSNGQPSA